MFLETLIYLIFIVSVATAAGSIVLSSRLRAKYGNEYFSTLLYYQAFIYTFGFYGIWGQVLISAFLPEYVSPELLARFSDIAILLGLPFLVFAWMMLIRFSSEISGRKFLGWHLILFLLVNFGIIIIVGYFVSKANGIRPFYLIKNYFLGMHFIVSAISSVMILLPGKGHSLLHDYQRRIISSTVLLITIVQCILLILYTGNVFIALAFILIFFAGNTFLPVYYNYGIPAFVIRDEKVEKTEDLSFEEFCKKFEVSPREKEIIAEICNGLSNKEISDKLFISLQTVKDHTHRIYIKTNVRNRVQLINLLKKK